jgi:tetratricopeptide (TPR) repeat protein
MVGFSSPFELLRRRLPMRLKIQIMILTTILGLTLTQKNIMAAGGGVTSSRPSSSISSHFAKGQKAVKASDFQSAVRYLTKAVKKNPNNADAQNLLGYSYRKLGKIDEAFEHYNLALKLNPKHRGANEYLGELYLETGQLTKAEERLEVLDKACIRGCEEYDELKEAIGNYKAERK